MSLRNILLGSLTAVAVNAIVFDAPIPTGAIHEVDMSSGTTPKPTMAPRPHFDFRKRTVVDSATCGFVSGSALYCIAGNTCATASVGGGLYQGCCDLGTCDFSTACYDYNAYTASICSLDCMANTANLVCTDNYLPYCQTYAFANGATAYECDVESASTVTPISTNYGAYIASPASTAAGDNSYPTTYHYNMPQYHHAISAFIPAIAVLVVYGLAYLSALIIIIITCRSHRRFMRSLDQHPYVRSDPMGARVAPVTVVVEQKPGATNVMMPMTGTPPVMGVPQQQYGFYPPHSASPAPMGASGPYYQQPYPGYAAPPPGY